jgi:uncharacterized protein YwqG/HEAT repeat protein
MSTVPKGWDELRYKHAIESDLQLERPIQALRLLEGEMSGKTDAEVAPIIAYFLELAGAPAGRPINADPKLFIVYAQGGFSRERMADFLSCPDPRVKLDALRKLGELQSISEVAKMEALFKDKDEAVRRQAVRSVSGIYYNAPAKKRAIADKLFAAGTIDDALLGLIASEYGEAMHDVERLLPYLLHPNDVLRIQAAESITEVFRQAKEDDPGHAKVEAFYRKHRQELSEHAFTPLVQAHGDWVGSFKPEIKKLFAAKDERTPWLAFYRLERAKMLTIDDLLPLLEDERQDMRERAFSALADIDPKKAEPHFVEALSAKRSSVRSEAIRHLQTMGARHHADKIAALLDDDDSSVRSWAKETLKEWGIKPVRPKTPLDGWKKKGLTDLDAFGRYLKATPFAPVADDVVKVALPSIRIIAKKFDKKSGKDEAESGASKFGGSPDLPKGFEWPMWNDVPLAFVAQINLEEVAKYDAEKRLPEAGMLYFFMDQEKYYEMPGSGKEKVIYVKAPGALRRTQQPAGGKNRNGFGSRAISFRREYTLPNPRTAWGRGLGELTQKYGYMMEQLGMAEADSSNRMFGHPNYIQGEFMEGQEDLFMLLQIDHDEPSSMYWGDGGRIMYLIYGDDLKAERFDQSVAEMQSS